MNASAEDLEDTTATEPPAEDLAQSLVHAIFDGAALKDIHGISDDAMKGVYAYAYKFYQEGKLDEAETFFRFLCLYDFYNAEYALGLGAVLQLRKRYQQAIDAYALSYALSRFDLRPLLQAGQCHLKLGTLDTARSCFQRVVDQSTDDLLIAKAQIYLEAIPVEGNGASSHGAHS
jgi:type III secretion system low calcium response chaperone LcrH/SycD